MNPHHSCFDQILVAHSDYGCSQLGLLLSSAAHQESGRKANDRFQRRRGFPTAADRKMDNQTDPANKRFEEGEDEGLATDPLTLPLPH
jgi:hypothetical protein